MPKSKLSRTALPLWHSLHITVTFILWMILIYIILYVHPHEWQVIWYVPFFATLFLTITFSLLFITRNIITAVLPSAGIISILVLRLIGMKDWLNPLLIIGLVSTLIYFFTVKEDSDTLSSTSIKRSTSGGENNKDNEELS